MKGSGTGTGCHPQLHLCLCRAGLTIHITGHLAKHGQVGLIDDRAEDPPPALFVQSKDPLPGHAKGHHPHGKEKQEEENVDQLPREEIRTVRTVLVVAGYEAWPLPVSHRDWQREVQGPRKFKLSNCLATYLFISHQLIELTVKTTALYMLYHWAASPTLSH